MERARAAGAAGIIVTLDWSFSFARDWGSPKIPEKMTLQKMTGSPPRPCPGQRSCTSGCAPERSPT
jgi:hypothetical protein